MTTTEKSGFKVILSEYYDDMLSCEQKFIEAKQQYAESQKRFILTQFDIFVYFLKKEINDKKTKTVVNKFKCCQFITDTTVGIKQVYQSKNHPVMDFNYLKEIMERELDKFEE
jgi:hypothetical protein